MTDDEILTGVCACVAETVDGDPATMRPGDRIIHDLGADSLDLLDLVFQLEQRFGVRIEPRGIERRARERLGGQPLEEEGRFTAAGVAVLREMLPEVPAAELPEGMQTAHLPYVFRIQTFVELVKGLREDEHERA